MVRQLLAALVFSCVLTSCTKTMPPTPGVLGVQFSGMWGKQPDMRIQKDKYTFLARLTGYVPPAAYMLVVTNQFGALVASSPIKYQDAMEANPVRHYQFTQQLTPATCDALLAKELDLRTQGNGVLIREEFTGLQTVIIVTLTAEVVTQTREVLAAAEYDVKVHCSDLGV